MPREEYQERLELLQSDVLEMSGVVLSRLRDSLKALDERDEELARRIVEGDAEINEMYLEIEQDCVDLIALQQPVAGDLRLIAASFKIITDLERIADLATNLGSYTVDAERTRYANVDIQELGAFAASMVEDSVRAYREEDVELCHEVAESDDILDERCENASSRVMRELMDERGDRSDGDTEAVIRDARRLLLTVRDLERVGDHGVNIAARALYMVENDDELIW